MRRLCNRVTAQGFYYPLTDQTLTDQNQSYQGHLKVLVYVMEGEDGHRHEHPHKNSPLFVPFSAEDKDYILHRNAAVTAEDISQENYSVLQRQWKLSPLKTAKYERERFTAIFDKLEQSLESLMQQAVPLGDKKMSQRNRFLGVFPQQLREGIDEQSCYGTLGKTILFCLYDDDFAQEKEKSKTGRSTLSIPIRFFNS